MALPVSGPISFNAINIELGLSGTATKSINDANYRALAGVASGTIDLQDFYGKSNITFTPNGGTSAGTQVELSSYVFHPGTASVFISCNQTAVWNWTRDIAIGTATVANGGSATSITFNLNSVSGNFRQVFYTLNATAGGITRYWRVELVADGG